MLAVLEWIYGPAAYSDPYFLLLRDFVVLMPWWYPLMWAGIIGSVVTFKLYRRLRVRHQTKKGVRRVVARAERIAAEAPEDHQISFILRRPANDVGPLLAETASAS